MKEVEPAVGVAAAKEELSELSPTSPREVPGATWLRRYVGSKMVSDAAVTPSQNFAEPD